jgi:hypothetical protein
MRLRKNLKSFMMKKSDNQNDCGCEGGCCPPKKKSIVPKVIFSLVVVAALGIILAKLFLSSPAPASNQKALRDSNSPVSCDSAGAKTCDTAKGSSCCPK